MPVETVLASAKKYHPKEVLEGAAEFLGMALNKAEIELPPEKIDEIRSSLSLLKTTA
jgi:hypothetical protein